MRKFWFTLTLTACGALSAADWPQFRGPNMDSHTSEAGLLFEWPADGLKKLWSTPVGDGGGGIHAGPVIVGGKVYTPGKVGTKDVIYCINAADGKELWHFDYEAPGQANWGMGMRATPTVANGKVYTLSRYGQVYCIDAEKGTEVWHKDQMKDYAGNQPGFGLAAAPLVFDNMVVIEPGGKGASLVALEAATGKEIWKAGDDASAYATPTLATIQGVKQIVSFPASGLVARDPKDGKELWRFDYVDKQKKNCAMPLVVDDQVFVPNNTLGWVAVGIKKDGDKWSVTKLWAKPTEHVHFSPAVLGDGCAFFHNGGGSIKCIDLKDGSVKWELPKMGQQQAMLLRMDDKHLLALLDTGEVVLMEATKDAGKQIARFQAVGGTSFSQPAIADGKLFVRDYKTIACFEIKK